MTKDIKTENLRRKPKADYSLLPNSIIRGDMSSDARFLWAMLNSYDVQWTFNRKHLMGECGWGRTRFDGAIKELKHRGLLQISPVRGEAGTFTNSDWHLFSPEEASPVSGSPTSVEPARGQPDNIRRQSNKKTNTSGKNKQKEFELKSEARKADMEAVFEKLWKHILTICPPERKTHISKKVSRKRFENIVTRKVSSIPATRIANAMLWYYDDPGQKKEDRKYFKSPQYVLGDELFEPFLDRGAFTKETDEAQAWHDYWQRCGEIYRSTGWDHAWNKGRHSRHLPEEYRKYFPVEDYEKLGWRKSDV